MSADCRHADAEVSAVGFRRVDPPAPAAWARADPCLFVAPCQPAEAPPLIAGACSADLIRQALALPCCGFIETGGNGLYGIGPRCRPTAQAGGLVLSLTTPAVCALPVVDLFGQAVRTRFTRLCHDTHDLIEICLAEAISNAVIHGNLGIPAHLRTSPQGFDCFRRIMHDRLTEPRLAERRVELFAAPDGEDGLSLIVCDGGPGFDLAAQLGREVPADARCGRGLRLIQRVCSRLTSEDGGRAIIMTFSN